MNERDSEKLQVELVSDLGGVRASQWDVLVGDDDPFAEYAFLRALETSGSVGGDSGWMPMHVLVRRGEALLGALPLYAKLHSYGEYIFDWAWAGAAERAGLSYYPKLVSMAPFTPATGRRVLMAPDADAEQVASALMAGAQAAAQEIEASSVHLLFLTEAERDLLSRHAELMPRLSLQFHWHNAGYETFDDYLGRFRSSLRKQVRRERRQANTAGLDIHVKSGPELSSEDWHALRGFYFDTCYRRGSGPYLTKAFFGELAEHCAARVVAVLAYREGKPIAGTLNFQKGKHLYGRYWGCTEEVPALHFELCYYRLIERAIEQGLERFEAGAQGTHKLRRGLLPAAIHSAHWVRHPGLGAAVAEFLPREAEHVRDELAELAMHGPFKRG